MSEDQERTAARERLKKVIELRKRLMKITDYDHSGNLSEFWIRRRSKARNRKNGSTAQ